MADLVEVEVLSDTVSVPVPEIVVGTDSISLPSIPGLSLPDLPVPDVRLTDQLVGLPSASVTVPDVSVRTDSVFLPPLPAFPYVETFTLDLDVDFQTFEFVGFLSPVTLPVGVDLIGPDISFGFFDPPDLPVLRIPDIDIRFRQELVGGGSLRIPAVDVTTDVIRLPDLAPVSFPSIPVPDVRVAVDQVAIPDPTTLRADVAVNTAEFRRVLLGPLPTGLLEDPPGYVFTAVVAEFESRIGDGLLGTLRRLVNSILESALSEETKQRLRDRAEE